MGSSNTKSEQKVPLQSIEVYEPPPAKVIEETKFNDSSKENEDFKNRKIYSEETMALAPLRKSNREDLFLKENGIIKAFKVHPEKILNKQDLTWHGKLRLQKDKDIATAYDRAKRISSSRHSDLASLVDQLDFGKGNEVQTFSAICQWIGTNITIDSSCKWNDDVTMVLTGMKSDAEGICRLLEQMCKKVNIECHTIRGLAKGPGYYPGYRLLEKGFSQCPFLHYWNKVRLENNWYLLDLSWAAGTYENGNFQAHFDDSHIICDPSGFAWLHLPLEDDNEVSLKDQLLFEPWKSVEFWAKRVVQSHISRILNVRPQSHTEGIIRTENNKAHLTFSCPHPMTYKIKLVNMRSQTDLSDYVMSYISLHDIHTKVHLPAMGSYWLTIEGAPVYTTKDAEFKPQMLFMYTIMGLSRKEEMPFPKIEGSWGASAVFNDAKFQLLKCSQAQIHANNGKAEFFFVVPSVLWIPLTYKITYRQDPNKDMKNFTYVERDMNLLNFFIICTDKGEYTLSITIPTLKDNSSEIVQETCNFLIICKHPNCQTMYPAFDGIWGPTKEGYEFGLAFEDLNSTHICHKGVCEITAAKSKPVDLDFNLVTTNDEDYPNAKRCINVESMGNESIFHLRIPKEGIYKFEVTGSKSGKDKKVVMAYLIDIRRPYGGDLYTSREASKYSGNVSKGVSTAFLDLELQCNYMESIIVTDSCPVFIEFTGKSCNDLLIEAEIGEEGATDDSVDEYISFGMVRSRDRMTFVINVTPGKSVRFSTDRDDGASLTNHLITWRPDFDEKNSTNYAIEPASNFYGPEAGFATFFVTGKQESWFLRSEDGVFTISQTLLRPLEGKELMLHFLQNGDKVKGAYYAELNNREIKFKIKAPKAGYFRFTGLIDGIEIFSYLLLATSPCKDPGFPYYKGLWGVTTYGFQQGVVLSGNTSSSTLNYSKGKALLDFQAKNVDVTLKLISYEDGRDLSKSIWVEYGNSSTHLTICPPARGMATLLLQDKKNILGRFLLIAEEPSTLRFPKVVDFMKTCRLFEPLLNPLTQNTEYYFELKVPPAVFLELREKYGRWKQSLPLIGGVFKGLSKIKASKSMMVVGFDDRGKEMKLLEYDVT